MKQPTSDPRGCNAHPWSFRIGAECAMCRHIRVEAELGPSRMAKANAGHWSGQSYGARKARAR